MPIYKCVKTKGPMDLTQVTITEHKGKRPYYLTVDTKGQNVELPCDFGKVYLDSDCFFVMIVAPNFDMAESLALNLLRGV